MYLKLYDGALIRIIALVQPPNVLKKPKPFCQIWFDGIEKPIVGEVQEYLGFGFKGTTSPSHVMSKSFLNLGFGAIFSFTCRE